MHFGVILLLLLTTTTVTIKQHQRPSWLYVKVSDSLKNIKSFDSVTWQN